MSDKTTIVQWLRDGAAEASESPEDQAWANRMREAADEIERLRKCGGPALCTACANEWRRKHGLPEGDGPIKFPGPTNLGCPFCGGEVDPEGWLSSEEDPETGNALRRGPECMKCGATAPDIVTWNQRA